MSEPVTLFVGLDSAETDELLTHVQGASVTFEMLPKYHLIEGRLFVDDRDRWGVRHDVRQVVTHAIFDIVEDTHWLNTLALWGGRCLPNPLGMLLARPRIQNLVIARTASRYAALPRGYAKAGATIESQSPSIAKWGEWHCGEGKERIESSHECDEPTLIEPFIEGEAVRLQIIGDSAWQVQLGGDDWKKSIHHSTAKLVEPDPRLVDDTRRLCERFGMELGAADYIIDMNGEPQLLEYNHIPNVTRFPEIRVGYINYVKQWLKD